MAYKYHNVVGLGDIHRPDDVAYANQTARLAGAGLTADHVNHLIKQTDVGSTWILTNHSPVTYAAFTPPTPVVGDIGKSVVVESDGSGGVRFAYDTGGSLWGRAGTVLSPQTSGDTVNAGSGSISAPGFGFTSDVDNGMYLYGPNQVGFTTGGAARAYIDLNGITSLEDLRATGTGSQIVLEANTQTSGNIASLKGTPGSGATVNVLQVEANGANWNTGSRVINIITDDNDALPLVVNDGVGDTLLVSRAGGIQSYDILNLSGTGSQIKLESHTLTSGNAVSIRSTPGSASTAVLLNLEAQGTNWGSGARVLKITTDDNDAYPIVINDGSSDKAWFYRSGSIDLSGDIGLLGGGTIGSSANGNVSIVPNGTGVFMCGTGTPGHLTPTSGEAYFQGIVEFDSDIFGDARIGIGATSFDGTAANILQITGSTEPAGSIADSVQFYEKDSSQGAGHGTLGLYLEEAVEAIGTFTPSHKLRLWINGTEYWMQLDAV